MRLLFIGGSNCVIKNGIADCIPKHLEFFGYNIEKTYNLSIGATTSLFGLENFNLSNIKDIDIVFIEYGINDYPLFLNDQKLWRYAYGELLRKVRDRYPNSIVISILLGRRQKEFWGKQKLIHDNMIDICKETGVLCVDVDRELKSISPSNAEFESLYNDETHFKSRAVEYISRLVASRYSLLYKDFLNNDINDVGDINFCQYSPGGKVSVFENSKLTRKTTFIEKNNSVELKVKGIPVALSFVMCHDSSSLLIETQFGNKIISTKNKSISEGKFPFLVKQIPLYGFFNNNHGINIYHDIKITAIDSNSHRWSDDLYQKSYGMLDDVDHSKGVYLSNVSTVQI
ncbi:SGNH/GDSL hydrolase family protein [Vibrio metschnikovii]|uniref:SGNH/GDSL hydrolase family protein n=1 Tax=Vibrio metschnikovii TaxID=28172 RepID=UPI001C305C1C|nr:SGNH/GDSL hydrolase family protein [Vibrio metschnikovii]